MSSNIASALIAGIFTLLGVLVGVGVTLLSFKMDNRRQTRKEKLAVYTAVIKSFLYFTGYTFGDSSYKEAKNLLASQSHLIEFYGNNVIKETYWRFVKTVRASSEGSPGPSKEREQLQAQFLQSVREDIGDIESL